MRRHDGVVPSNVAYLTRAGLLGEAIRRIAASGKDRRHQAAPPEHPGALGRSLIVELTVTDEDKAAPHREEHPPGPDGLALTRLDLVARMCHPLGGDASRR